MARQKNDGRGRMGGRQKGTPNKDAPLKVFLRQHSQAYFEPVIIVDESLIEDLVAAAAMRQGVDVDAAMGRKEAFCPFAAGDTVSQFDIDCQSVAPDDRVKNEIALLKFHTPQMQSTSVDMTVSDDKRTLTERLASLSSGQN